MIESLLYSVDSAIQFTVFWALGVVEGVPLTMTLQSGKCAMLHEQFHPLSLSMEASLVQEGFTIFIGSLIDVTAVSCHQYEVVFVVVFIGDS